MHTLSNLARPLHNVATNLHTIRAGAAGPHTNLTTMPPALDPHGIPDDAYASLQNDLGGATSSYPTFSTALHHDDSTSDRNPPGFGVSSPLEHHALHTHIEHNGLHLDPILSPRSSRHFHAPGPGAATHPASQHDYNEQPMPSARKYVAAPPPIPPNSAPPGQFDMMAPTTSTHNSWQALHAYAQTHASTHGYALAINTTAKNRSRIKLACVCYGTPKNTHKLTPETRVRKNRASYKTDCKMWIEGKKTEDGLWLLRVGEAAHNHEGRPSEGWAVQRKRTWGVKGGRVGFGGVTAQQEREEQQQQSGSMDQEKPVQDDTPDETIDQGVSHSLENGGLAWKIVEQEMMRKVAGGVGRDRGVGRTIKVLKERLPGIHIFKRDIYNIRAQLRRARRAADQQLGDKLLLSEDKETPNSDAEHDPQLQPEPHLEQQLNPPPQQHIAPDGTDQHEQDGLSRIDPSLIAQCNSALEQVSRSAGESELDRLRGQVSSLQHELELRTKELEEKNAVNEMLKNQLELANMALYNRQDHGPGQ